MATANQAKAFLGVTDAQLVKVVEYLDAVSPKVDGDGDPVANSIDDLRDHIVEHYSSQYKSWKKSQESAVTF